MGPKPDTPAAEGAHGNRTGGVLARHEESGAGAAGPAACPRPGAGEMGERTVGRGKGRGPPNDGPESAGPR